MSGSAEVHRHCNICSTVELENNIRVTRYKARGRSVVEVLICYSMNGDDLRGFSRGRQPGRTSSVESIVNSSTNLMRLRQRQPRLKLNSEEYTVVRNQVLERDGWRCQDCGTVKDLQVHHMKPRSQLGGETHNLITLCARCHEKRHGWGH